MQVRNESLALQERSITIEVLVQGNFNPFKDSDVLSTTHFIQVQSSVIIEQYDKRILDTVC